MQRITASQNYHKRNSHSYKVGTANPEQDLFAQNEPKKKECNHEN